MARNETSRLKITIDIDKATGKILQFNQTLGNTEKKVKQTGGAMSQLATQTNAAGQSAAASAVNFQTFSMGLLNLSTSAVQTYTSISNLARAQNRAEMSIIAVARAEDLLANKQERANAMVQSGTAGGQKYVNILREIETAEADLLVKKDKMKIEQDAVNDVYMLFGANIANVAISSMQTIAVMDKNQIILTKAKTVALKIHNAAMFTSAKAAWASVLGYKADAVSKLVATTATAKLTLAVKGLTAATRAFMMSNPILIAAMAAGTAALLAYETNFMGLKDAIHGTTEETKSFKDGLDEARAGVEGLDFAVEGLDKSVGFKLPDSLGTAMVSLDRYSSKLRDMQKEAVITAAVNQAVADSMDNVAQKKTTISDSVGFSLLPKAFAETTDKPIDEQAYREWLSASGIHGRGGGEFVGGTTMLPLNATQLSARHGISEEAYNALPDEAKEFLETRDIILPYLSTFVGDKSFRQAEITQRGFDTQTKFYTPQTWKEEKLKLEGDRIEREERLQLPRERLQLSEISNRIYNTYYGRFGTGGFSSKEYANLVRQEAAKAGINMSKYKNTIMNGINLFTGEQVTSLREQAGYEITDKPEAIRNKMIGTLSGIYDKDDPRIKLLLSGKSDITEERLAILAKYGVDVGMGGQEEEAIMVKHYQSLGDSRKDLMSEFLKGGTSILEGGYIDEYGNRVSHTPNMAGTTPFQQRRQSLGQISMAQFEQVNEMTSILTNNAIAAATRYNEQVIYGEATGSMARSHAAAQWLGRMTWYKEQNRNYTVSRGGSGHGIVNHYVRNAVNDEDRQAMANLANSHDQQVREYGEEAFERGKDLDILWLRKQTENQAKALSASISMRVTAERATALEFGNQLGISQNEALQILRDKSQGEQTLNDMLAYQQRLDAMSNGVVS